VVVRFLLTLLLTLCLCPVWAQDNGLTITADLQEANANTRIVTAKGNVRLAYPAKQLTARAQRATYDERKGTVTLTGSVMVEQLGRNRLNAQKITYFIKENRVKAEPTAGEQVTGNYTTVTETGKESGVLAIRADRQEANSTQVVANGNIRLDYPARQIVATAQKATYNTKERTIVMEGNVSVLQQEGNTLQGESITYSLAESRFIASPSGGKQVKAVYTLPPETKTKTPVP
jgi:lipopolysaccharide export system protein LptA